LATTLDALHHLQTIDTRLIEKRRAIERFEASLAERRAAIAAVDARIDGLTAARKDLVGQRALAERKVEDLQESLRQKKQRAQKARNEKEVRAGQDEISSAQEEIAEAESLLLDLMAKVEDIESTIAQAKAERAEHETEDHRQVEVEAARIAALRAQVEAGGTERAEAASAVEPALLKKYEMLLERRAGLAVAIVEEGGGCSGCHVQIPPQMLIEIRKTAAVRVCPMCQRLLYVPEPPPESDETGDSSTT